LENKVSHLKNWEDGILLFTKIEILKLGHNKLDHIDALNLHCFQNLHTLDLRHNKFKSLEHVIEALRSCDSLKVLYLHHATGTDETTHIHKFSSKIFKELRNLDSCDDLKNPYKLTNNPLDISAAQFFKELINVGPNSINRVNLRNKSLPDRLFVYIISALHQLQTEIVWLDQNEWSQSIEYADTVIVCLIKNIKVLDDEVITDDRRRIALNVNKEKKYDHLLLPWKDIYQKAFEELHKGKINKTYSSEDFKNIKDWKELEHGIQQNVNIIRAVSDRIGMATNYWQTYNIVSNLHLGTLYPQAWDSFNDFTNAITLHFEKLYHIDDSYRVTIIYITLMILPLFVLSVYYFTLRLQTYHEQFIYYHIDRWKYTYRVVCIPYILLSGSLLVISVLYSDLAYVFVSAVLFLLFTFIIFALWFALTIYLKYVWNHDLTDNKLTFHTRWFASCHLLQSICLYALSQIYMPLCSNIFDQYQCNDGTSQLYPGTDCFPGTITKIQESAFLFGFLYIIGIPILYCIMIKVNVDNITNSSIEYKLINEELDEIDNLHEDIDQKLNQNVKKILNKNLINERKRLHGVKERIYDSLINSAATQTPMTSIFSSFRQSYKYWNVLKMFLILALLIITYVPDQFSYFQAGRVFLASLILGLYTLLMIVARPYNERIGNIMDFSGSFANVLNCLITIGINENLSRFETTSIILLFIINIPTMIIFGYGIFLAFKGELDKKKENQYRNVFDQEEQEDLKKIELAESIERAKNETEEMIINEINEEKDYHSNLTIRPRHIRVDSKTKIPVYDHRVGIKSILHHL
jgi:hypothetical protein